MVLSSSDASDINDQIKRLILIVQNVDKILRFIDTPIALNTKFSYNRDKELKQKSEFYLESGLLVYENHVTNRERILNEVLEDCPLIKTWVNGRDIFLLRSGIFLECMSEETSMQDLRGNQMPSHYQQIRTNPHLIVPEEIVTHYGQDFESELVWHIKNAVVWEVYAHPRKKTILAHVAKFLSKIVTLPEFNKNMQDK